MIKEIYKNIYIAYNPAEDPYFKMHIDDCLRSTKASPAMQKLLKRISKASPVSGLGAAAPKGCRVLVRPPEVRKLVPSMRDPNVKSWHYNSKTSASEMSNAAATDGSGSASMLYISSREYRSSPLNITFAHELIHCMHAAEGKMNKDSKLEEYATVGIHGYEAGDITENRIRSELGIPLRATYFLDDPADYRPFVTTGGLRKFF